MGKIKKKGKRKYVSEFSIHFLCSKLIFCSIINFPIFIKPFKEVREKEREEEREKVLGGSKHMLFVLQIHA